jgi:hypothetical protein
MRWVAMLMVMEKAAVDQRPYLSMPMVCPWKPATVGIAPIWLESHLMHCSQRLLLLRVMVSWQKQEARDLLMVEVEAVD